MRRKGKTGRERGGSQRAEGVERGSRLPSAKDSLTVINAVQREACPGTFPSTDSTPRALSVFIFSLSFQYLPLLLTQTMNKRDCLRTAEKQAEGRHFLETVANNSREFFFPLSVKKKKAGSWPYVCPRSSFTFPRTNYRPDYWIPNKHHIWVQLRTINKLKFSAN